MTSILIIISLALLVLFFASRVYPNTLIFWTSHKTKNMSFVYLFLFFMLFIPAVIILNTQPQVSDASDPLPEDYLSSDTSYSENSSSAPVSSDLSNSSSETVSAATPATIKVDKNLESGNYVVGIDIPQGTYDLTAVKGGGNVTTNSGSLNEIMGVASKGDMYTPSYNNLTLYDGDILEIRDLTLNIKSDDASGAALNTRANKATKSYTFSAGNYSVGKDIEEGAYDIKVVSGSGNVQTEKGVLNLIMGTRGDDMYLKNFTNAPLISGDTLILKGNVKLKLTPSK